jgi:hypothetical protein
MTIVLNFIGGPGVGKSTLASGSYHMLKSLGKRAEFAYECIKDWPYRGMSISRWDEYYIAMKQLRVESAFYGKADFIVSERPLILSSVFEEFYFPDKTTIRDLIRSLIKERVEAGITDIDLLVDRRFKYQEEGRNESQEQAKAVCALCRKHAPGATLVSTVDDVKYILQERSLLNGKLG